MRMDFTEMLVRVRSFPWVKPQEKREATAPAAMAAATEEPVFRVSGLVADDEIASRVEPEKVLPSWRGSPGPCTSTPGAARSGLICPVAVKPRLLVCLPKLLWIANALQKLLEQANGNLPIEKNENPELIRYAADIIRKYADGLSHDERSAKEICEENRQNIA